MNLSIHAIAAALASLPAMQKPLWVAFVARPDVSRRFESETPLNQRMPRYGVPIYEKDQIADSWAFSDIKLCKRYLDGELTEMDLAGMISEHLKPTYAPKTI